MKPLKEFESFLERFDSFKDGELRSIDIVSPTNINITLAGQDSGRAFDWVSVVLELSGISDASLVENSKLNLVDMSEGVSIINSANDIILKINSSTIYLTCKSIKYEEGEF